EVSAVSSVSPPLCFSSRSQHTPSPMVPEEENAQLRGYYALESNWGALEAQVLRGADAQIVIVDPELNECSQTIGPGAVATLGADYGTEDADSDGELDGLPLYTYQDNDPAGTWRGIFMANDNGGVHSPKWRTHEPVRMLTANVAKPEGWATYTFQYARDWADAVYHGHAAVGVTTIDGWGSGTWVMGWYPAIDWVAPHPVPGLLKLAWVEPGVEPLGQQIEHGSSKHGREMVGSEKESRDVLERVTSDWLNDTGRALFFSCMNYGMPAGNTELLGEGYTSRRWGIITGPGADSHHCAHFAALVSGKCSKYVAVSPLALDLYINNRHNSGDREYSYLRGIYSGEAHLEVCDCDRCTRVRAHWPTEDF
ncbi:MAG: hypothetical protein GX131_04110, partial [candidate division WS1 bacterium]|nr:hypothetical protein [candidate division WS1 bacterium]